MTSASVRALLVSAFALAGSATAAPPPLPPATIDNGLEVGGAPVEAQALNTRMTIAVRVNDRGPYRFLVDSGADTSVIGARLAKALQLPSGTPVILNGTTASSQVDRVQVASLAYGSDAIQDLQLPVLDERFIGADGLIGIDALARQRLMLDFEARIITVEDASIPSPHAADDEIVVTARRRGGQLILTQAKIAGRPVDAIVDTGSDVTIGNLALRNALLRQSGAKLMPIVISGVTGVKVDLEMMEVAELRLGPVVLHNVPIAFAELPPFRVFGLSRRPALLLGTDLMATFRRVSLDFRARKVRFQVRRCRAEGIGIATTSELSRSRLSLAEGGGSACRR